MTVLVPALPVVPPPVVRRRAALLGVVLLAVLATLLVPPAAVAAPGRNDTRPRASFVEGRATAERTLARAQRLLAHKSAGAAAGQLSAGRDATMVLRRLWLQRDSLSPADRRAAAALGTRPTDTDQVTCSLTCVHWNSAETTADFAATVSSTMDYVQGSYTAAGYRSPKSDEGRGGNDLPDVYLDDVGKRGLYGYCTSDQDKPTAPGRYDVWAFCVLDNDFSPAEFPAHTPVENMQVTAAHEFFHATQYAYDSAEDAWFLESLAVWAEDELFPAVDDNLQYLPASILERPRTSLDKAAGTGVYGGWIWIRYLTEKYPRLKGPLPKIVLRMFRAMSSAHGPTRDLYSVQALERVLRSRGGLAATFAAFADANRRPATSYAEGSLYPTAAPWKEAAVAKGDRVRGVVRINHLASATARLTPTSDLTGPKTRLRLRVDLADRSTGSAAVVSTYATDGTVTTQAVPLDAAGDATVKVGFAASTVAAVELTLVNASTRYAGCGARVTPFACSGTPVDQQVSESFTAVVRGAGAGA